MRHFSCTRGAQTNRVAIVAMSPNDGEVYKNPSALGSEEAFRSPQSDIEIPKTRKRKGDEGSDKGDSTATLTLDPLAMTKENMSTTRRPADSAFTQQRLFGWQPILTPYNVLPVLFILGLVFLPLGIVFLSASIGVQQYDVDYSGCLGRQDDKPFSVGAGKSIRKTGPNECEIQFDVTEPIKGPVFVYYRLTNFYQNNRLYAKSRSDAQLRGEALTAAQLNDCDPLIADPKGNVYYPCGLVANSYFSDTFSSLKNENGKVYEISSEKIAWPGDEKLYGESKYDLSKTALAVPPSWANREDIEAENGFYKKLPNLAKDERFQNWMKISGLPTFRKLYGRIDAAEMEKGRYTVTVKDKYEVTGYQGTKSFVISTTNWAGGKNEALGYGFIAVGGLLLVLGLVFLIMFMMAPRKVGDVSYLSWYSENSGDPLANEGENGEEIHFDESQ